MGDHYLDTHGRDAPSAAPTRVRMLRDQPRYRPARSPLQSMGPSFDDERRRRRAARRIAIASAVGISSLVFLVWIVSVLGREVVRSADPAAAATAAAAPLQQTGPPEPLTVADAVASRDGPALRLQLPIRMEAVTGVGFLPRRESGLLELQPRGSRANVSWLERTTQRFLATEPANDLNWYQLGDGTPSMTIVGARPGTEVYAPIDGKIEAISEYELSGEMHGVIVQLQPTGDLQTLVVMRNLDLADGIAVGQSVNQSVTKLGTVHAMDGAVDAPLADYTHDSGSGIDMYVRRVETNAVGGS